MNYLYDINRPILLEGLFKPPDELSALVVMELLYYYALAHTDSFDVRWIRKGSITSTLIAPLAKQLKDTYGLIVLNNCRADDELMYFGVIRIIIVTPRTV
jgi:hypothetical protein